MCQHPDLLLARFELLHTRQFQRLAGEVAADLRRASPETAVTTHLLSFDDPWDFEQVYAALHDWAVGYPFRPEDERYLVHITTGSHVAQICLFLLTESRLLPGQLVQTVPPRRQDPHPGSFELIDLDLSRYDRLAERFKRQRHAGVSLLKSGIETRSPTFNAMIEEIEKVAIHSTAPMLLTGPTGSGKSHLARQVFELKKSRRQVAGPFVEVNCATLRGDGAMSALFGHKRGAFTGAAADRAGLLRSADAGVLFLDEVGELGPDEQAMLLRAVEQKRFLPVGSDREGDQRLPADRRHQPRPDGRRRRRPVPRRPARSAELVDVRAAPAPRPARGHRAEPGVRAGPLRRARRGPPSASTARPGTGSWRSPPGRRPPGPATSATLNGAVVRLATLAGGGRITVEGVERRDRPPDQAMGWRSRGRRPRRLARPGRGGPGPVRPRASWPRWCGCAGGAGRCPTPAGRCSPPHAGRRRTRTTPTGSASTWPEFGLDARGLLRP